MIFFYHFLVFLNTQSVLMKTYDSEYANTESIQYFLFSTYDLKLLTIEQQWFTINLVNSKNNACLCLITAYTLYLCILEDPKFFSWVIFHAQYRVHKKVVKGSIYKFSSLLVFSSGELIIKETFVINLISYKNRQKNCSC